MCVTRKRSVRSTQTNCATEKMCVQQVGVCTLSSVVPQTVWLVGLRSVSLFLQFLVSCFLQSMSLPVDMKMIRSPNFSGWILFSSIALCISHVVCPGKFLHLNTTGFPSVRSNSRCSWDFVNDSIFSFQASILSRAEKNVYLCFRQLDGSVVQQGSSHPWNSIPTACRCL